MDATKHTVAEATMPVSAPVHNEAAADYIINLCDSSGRPQKTLAINAPLIVRAYNAAFDIASGLYNYYVR